MGQLSSKIESVLFWKAEPISIKKLAELLTVSEEEVSKALDELDAGLKGRGISLMRKENEVALATAPDHSALIEKLIKEELSRDVGRAGLETLSIVLYYGPISRRDIDYIRGVNSAFIVRHLLVRGLIERCEDSKDQRVFLYKPTFDLLAHLGVAKAELLPEYEKVRGEYMTFLSSRAERENEDINAEAGKEDHNELPELNDVESVELASQ